MALVVAPPPPVIMKTYKYTNHSLNMEATLSTARGQIYFTSPSGGSGWHGTTFQDFNFTGFQPEGIATMSLDFNFKGAQHRLHHCEVTRNPTNGFWTGVDHRGRCITMQLLGEWMLSGDGITWTQLYEPLPGCCRAI